ncbi:MAG: Maf family protein [Candidatus Kaelpia aquatica]|nr:Maf family protein [Candidatus Kaelpia aquatica]
MVRIILASGSKARQDLLRQIGLDFSVVIPVVEEERELRFKPEDLVISNALKKAEDVASKIKSGIIIGADTVVLSNESIIGKPNSMDQAFAILKEISQKPHWVYTGLAVVNLYSGERYTAYEKTQIFMRDLSDNEIRDYFKKVNPMDKAGAFDIQGLGAIFIERIEGCFYNVVGLPLARLMGMLKKMGVSLLAR